MSDIFRNLEFAPLPMSDFMDAIPGAVLAACDQIGFPRPSGVFVQLTDAHKAEFLANETVVEAVHPGNLSAVDTVRGLSGHADRTRRDDGEPISVVATLRREFCRPDEGGIRVFWAIRAVRVPVTDDPSQLRLF